jgi:methionyl-tRNA formyltransferase
LLEALPGRCENTLQAMPQSQAGVTYAEKLSKTEAQLDFAAPAAVLHRQVRAFNPWPVAEAWLVGERVRIWQSRLAGVTAESAGKAEQAPGTIVEITDDALLVSTGDGLIELLQLQWPGKKAQPAVPFSQGHNPGQGISGDDSGRKPYPRQHSLIGARFGPA